jgi:hypothetical protein
MKLFLLTFTTNAPALLAYAFGKFVAIKILHSNINPLWGTDRYSSGHWMRGEYSRIVDGAETQAAIEERFTIAGYEIYSFKELTPEQYAWTASPHGLALRIPLLEAFAYDLHGNKRYRLHSLINRMEARRALDNSRYAWHKDWRYGVSQWHSLMRVRKNLAAEIKHGIVTKSARGFCDLFMDLYSTTGFLTNVMGCIASRARARFDELDVPDFIIEPTDCGHWEWEGDGYEVITSNYRHTTETYCHECAEDSDIVVIADDTGNHILRDEAYWCEYNERYVEFEDNVEDRYSDDDDSDSDNSFEDRPRSLMNYSFDVLQIVSRDTSFESTSFGDFHMGVELELVTPESRHDAVEDLRSQLGMDYCVCKEDGSLPDGGIEVVTAPRKLTEHIDRFSKWQVKSIYRAWNTNRCGMHVHVDSRAFTRLVLGKFIMFINASENTTFIRQLAGRHPSVDSQAQSYCAAEGQLELANPSKALKGKSTSRYFMVNTTCLTRDEANRLGVSYVGERNFNTIELRIFRASLKKARLLAQIEFTHAIIMFCRIASYRDLNGDSFVKWLGTTDNRYPHLSDWYGIRRRVSANNTAPAPVSVPVTDDTPNE